MTLRAVSELSELIGVCCVQGSDAPAVGDVHVAQPQSTGMVVTIGFADWFQRSAGFGATVAGIEAAERKILQTSDAQCATGHDQAPSVHGKAANFTEVEVCVAVLLLLHLR